MGGILGTLRALVTANTTSFDKGLRKSAKGIKSFAAGFTKLGLVAGVAGAVISKFLDAQSKQINAVNELNRALAAQGNLLPGVSQRLQDNAKALQDMTTFGDEAILASQGLLATFGMNEEQIIRATRAALDFSTATGGDLKLAMNLLGKAFVGRTAELSRYGIIIDDSIEDADKFAAVLQQLEDRFAGAAETATKDFGGGMKQVGNSMGDVFEDIGKLINEFFNFGGSVGSLRKPLDWLAGFFGQTLVRALGKVRAGFAELVMMWFNGLADIQEKAAAVAKFLGFDELAAEDEKNIKKLRERAAAYQEIANQLNIEAEASAKAAGKLQKQENQTNKTTKATKELTDAQKEALKVAEAKNKALDDEITRGVMAREAAEIKAAAAREEAENKKQEAAEQERLAQALDETALSYSLMVAEAKALGDLDAAQEAAEQAKSYELMAKELRDGVVPQTRSWAQELANIANMLQSIGGAGGFFGKLLGGAAGIGSAFDSLKAGGVSGIGSLFSGGITKIIKNAVPALSAAFAAFDIGKAVFGSLFGDKEHEQVNDMRDEFVAAAGGITELNKQAQKAGLTLDRMLNAKTVQQYQAAIDELTGRFDLQAEATRLLNEAIERYGFTIEELGPKWQQQRLDEMAGQLLTDFELLIASGIELAVVLEKMGPAFNEYVQKSIKAGRAIPEAMRPIIEDMIEQGLLLDENGVAYESLEATGLTFTESLSEGLQRVIDKLDELINALLGFPTDLADVTVKPHPGHEVNPDEFATGGVGSFGAGKLAALHGREAVIPLDSPADRDRVMAEAGLSGGGGEVMIEAINIYPHPNQSPEEIGREVVRQIRRATGAGAEMMEAIKDRL